MTETKQTDHVVQSEPGANDLIKLGYRLYTYKHSKNRFYYVTINGVQCGGVLFSIGQVKEAHEAIKRGEKW